MNTSQWVKEAEEQARKKAEEVKTNNQYILNQLLASKNNSLNQLNNQQQGEIYNLNSNKSSINSSAESDAKMANINRMLALKSNEQAMNRAGLGTQGIVGSQVNAINSDYGNTLTGVSNNKRTNLNELDKAKNQTNLNYDNSRIDLENNYGNNLISAQQSIDNNALNQYNTAYQNVLSLKQQQYENEQAQRQYEDALKQQAFENQLQLKSLSSNIGSGLTGEPADLITDEKDSFGNGAETQNLSNYYFKSTTGANYQPRYINNTKLTKSGITAGQLGLSGVGSSKNIWKAGNKYFVWKNNEYIDVTQQYKQATK